MKHPTTFKVTRCLAFLPVALCLGFASVIQAQEHELVPASAVPTKAREAVMKVFDQRFARIGDSYYSVQINGYPNPRPIGMDLIRNGQMKEPHTYPLLLESMQLTQIKSLRWKYFSIPVSAADKLNGVEWQGGAILSANVSRARVLDLTASHQALLRAKDRRATLPWTSHTLTWINIQDDQPGVGEEILRANPFAGDVPGQIRKMLLDGFKASEWSDWEDASDTMYQGTAVQIRNGKVVTETEQSVEKLHSDKNLYYRIPGTGGGLEAMGEFRAMELLENVGSVAFLLRPDMVYIRKQGLLRDENP